MMNGSGRTATRRAFLRSIAAGAVVCALPVPAKPADIPAIVTPGWLAKNLGDSRMLLLDIRSTERYKKGHIPGSVNVPLASWAVSGNGLLLELPPENALRDLIGKSGIGPDSRVVIVNTVETDFSRADAARVAWTLAVAGLDNVAILDGGYSRWLKEIKSFTEEVSRPNSASYTGTMNRNLEASKDYLLQKIGKAVVVDARLPEDYFGITSKGHIKSAVNLPAPWAFTDDGTFRRTDELRAMASGVIGSSRSKEVILYCGVGGFAAAWWFLLTRVLEYQAVRVYDGSFEEWEKDPAAPISAYTWR